MITATSARSAYLTRDALRSAAPSVFATEPWGAMSARYGFVPTIAVVDQLADMGYAPVRAQQSTSRIEGKTNFTQHMIRFRHVNFLRPDAVGDEFPELVAVNSHDGSGLIRFMAGLFRLKCLNGAVASIGDLGGFAIRHVAGPDFHKQVFNAVYNVADQANMALERATAWRNIALDSDERIMFAESAILARNATLPVTPAQLLNPVRPGDEAHDLWTTFNVVQEHLIRGGLRTHNAAGRRASTRAIKSVGEDLKINRSLWTLASRIAEIKGA
jgi:hypothetical protein